LKTQKKHTGFAIAIAWPQTYCKQPGTWYDPITRLLGINYNNYYLAGHAALVLVDTENRKGHYFDFGRYHAPFQHGRVRSAETDHDLEIKTIPELSGDGQKIINYRDILFELQCNPACHGEGELFASYCPVNFQLAFNTANLMQQNSPIPYGPFRYNGSNCSRFVNTAIMAGNPQWKYKFRLKYMVPLTPTPMNNVNSLNNRLTLPIFREEIPFFPFRKLDTSLLKTTLHQPDRNPKIPKNAQWLSGEGAGSWFVFEFQNNLLKVTRYSPGGVLECSGFYKNSNGHAFEPESSFRITYPSNCKVVSLTNKETEIRFERANP